MRCQLQGTVHLPGSKSESNRALMIAAYGGFSLEVDNLSEAHDTVLLKSLLERPSSTVDCEDAGTVARFLLTYLANKPGTWMLTGTERLCQRPMSPLIDALRRLGADITCLEKPGCLPAQIRGKELEGGSVELDASLSSQFASSLLLAAPTWRHGLQLRLTGDPVSMPYLEMTVKIMEHYGIQIHREGNEFMVAPQPYRNRHFVVEADWSAASYWYEMMALSSGGSLLLKGLRSDSLQGDSRVAELFQKLGVETEFVQEGVKIASIGVADVVGTPLLFDFLNTPDLFPSILVSCVVLHKEAVFYNITTLYNKESDRVNVLITELSRLYTFINILSYNKLIIGKSSLLDNSNYKSDLIFKTYQDHRVAMALAGLKMFFSGLDFDNPEVVNKSFPGFWKEVQNVVAPHNYF